MKRSNTRPSALVLGSALTGGLLLSGGAFAMNDLAGGYMQDSTAAAQDQPAAQAQPATQPEAKTTKTADGKCGEGKCGEGKCGSVKAGEAMFAKMDVNQDGNVSREEFAAQHGGSSDHFASHDGNGDGLMTKQEMHAAHAKMHGKDAKPGAGEKKAAEGKCGEGKCGEGKCGGSI